MTGAEMEQFARIGAIIAGIVFGGWALSSVIWVWTKKQIYAYGGSALSVVGVILMGLSIYKTVDVKAAPDGIGIKLAEVENLLKEQGAAQQVTQQKLAQIPVEFGAKLTALDKAVKDQGAAQLAQFNELKGGGSIVQRASGVVDPSDPDWMFGGTPYTKPKTRLGTMTKMPDGWLIYDFDTYKQTPEEIQRRIKEYKGSTGQPTDPALSALYAKWADALQADGRYKEARFAYEQSLKFLPLEDVPKKAVDPNNTSSPR